MAGCCYLVSFLMVDCCYLLACCWLAAAAGLLLAGWCYWPADGLYVLFTTACMVLFVWYCFLVMMF
jgi:hypothetical protein